MVQGRAISTKIFTYRVSGECTCKFSQKLLFRHFLEFVRNTKKRTERFQRNFWPKGYLQSVPATFPKNRFLAIFGGHLKFLRKTQKRIYLGNSELERF